MDNIKIINNIVKLCEQYTTSKTTPPNNPFKDKLYTVINGQKTLIPESVQKQAIQIWSSMIQKKINETNTENENNIANIFFIILMYFIIIILMLYLLTYVRGFMKIVYKPKTS